MFLKYGLPVVAMLLLAVAVYHVFHSYPGEPTQAALIAPAKSPFVHALAATGAVEPSSDQISVAAPMPGIVAEVFVEPGQHVPASAPLFRLDDRSLLADLKVREARVAVAKADNTAELQPVTLGRDFGDFAEITTGLTEQERIITNPPDSIIDGERLNVQTESQRDAVAAQGGNK